MIHVFFDLAAKPYIIEIADKIKSKWESVAKALNFNKDLIKNIKSRNSENPLDECKDMLQEYLDGNGKYFTKSILAVALVKAGCLDAAETHGLLKSLNSIKVKQEPSSPTPKTTSASKTTIPLMNLSILAIITIIFE